MSLGALLSVPIPELRIIDADPSKSVKDRCNEMLEKWLENATITPSWKIMRKAIESPSIKYRYQDFMNKCKYLVK